MKFTRILNVLAITGVLIGCEPLEIDNTGFNPNGADTTSSLGFKMSMKTNGVITMYNSQGVGVSCTDPALGTIWGLATGDSVYYDPTTGNIQTLNPNDTMLVVMWLASNNGIGTYVPAGLNSPFPGFCAMQTASGFVEYDPSQLQINITKLTIDSIYGNYGGPLSRIIWQPDSTGTFVPVPTGQVDSVNATFEILRSPC